MLNAKQFNARLESIKKSDEKFRVMIAEALAFAIYHARNHGQKTPFINLQNACPGWLQKGLKAVALGKKKITENECEYEAEFRVSEWFATHEEQKAIRNANRKAKAEATVTNDADVTSEDTVTPETIEGEFREVTNGLILNGMMIDLSDAEAEALSGYLMSLRLPALKVA